MYLFISSYLWFKYFHYFPTFVFKMICGLYSVVLVFKCIKFINNLLYNVDYLSEIFTDFRRRFISLMSYQFREFTPSMSLNVLQQKQFKPAEKSKYLCCFLFNYWLVNWFLDIRQQETIFYHSKVFQINPTF